MTSLKTAAKEIINLSDMLFLFLYVILFIYVCSQEELCMNGGVQLAIDLTFDKTIPLSMMSTNWHKHRVL